MSEYAGLEATTELVSQLKAITGDKTLLETTDKSTLVNAVNELYDSIFDKIEIPSGAAWDKAINTSNKIYALAATSDNVLLLGRESDGTYYSTDKGSTWTNSMSQQALSFVVMSDNTILCNAYNTSYTLRSTNKGVSWTASTTTFSDKVTYISKTNDDICIACVLQQGIYYSTDKGVTWTQSNITTGTFNGGATLHDNTLVIGGSTGVYYSTDKGVTWTQSNLTLAGMCNFGVTSDDIIVVGSDSSDYANGVYYSTDKGITWTQSSLTSSAIVHFAVTNNDTIIAGSSSAIYYSTNKGITWTQSNDTNRFNNFVVLPNNRVIAGSNFDDHQTDVHNIGLYYSDDNGVTWQASNVLVTTSTVLGFMCSSVVLSDSTVLVGTNKLGLYISESIKEVKPKWETAIEQLASQLNA